MKRIWVAASILALTIPVAGCSGGIGETLRRLARGSSTSAEPTPAVSSADVVAKARPSVVKVHGEAESCLKITEGSGFVVAPNKVMTNAHVVAGAETFSVDAERTTYGAQVISYDPQADIAILDVPGLSAEPLKFAEYTAGTGVDALVLGFPGAASFQASPAQVREVTELNGPGYLPRDVGDATGVHSHRFVPGGGLERQRRCRPLRPCPRRVFRCRHQRFDDRLRDDGRAGGTSDGEGSRHPGD